MLLAAAAATCTATAGAQQFDVMEATIPGVQAAMLAKRLTCRALVQAYLDRIAAYDQSGPALNAIQHVNARALTEADSLDAVLRAKGPRGPLHCVPVLLKDQIETKDMPTTYGSAIFKDFVPKRDATVVQRLEAAGAIVLAKTTMGEFAGRYVGSAAGVIRNAYDPTRNPSGSSGGSASGITANFGLVGIGEDTGGSIRGPAAVSSLVGLRPTLPLVSRFGMLPANPTQDTMGPMTRTVADAARLLDVMAGFDTNDPVTAYAVGHVPATYTASLVPTALRGARVGVIRFPRDTMSTGPHAIPHARHDCGAAHAPRHDRRAHRVAGHHCLPRLRRATRFRGPRHARGVCQGAGCIRPLRLHSSGSRAQRSLTRSRCRRFPVAGSATTSRRKKPPMPTSLSTRTHRSRRGRIFCSLAK